MTTLADLRGILNVRLKQDLEGAQQVYASPHLAHLRYGKASITSSATHLNIDDTALVLYLLAKQAGLKDGDRIPKSLSNLYSGIRNQFFFAEKHEDITEKQPTSEIVSRLANHENTNPLKQQIHTFLESATSGSKTSFSVAASGTEDQLNAHFVGLSLEIDQNNDLKIKITDSISEGRGQNDPTFRWQQEVITKLLPKEYQANVSFEFPIVNHQDAADCLIHAVHNQLKESLPKNQVKELTSADIKAVRDDLKEILEKESLENDAIPEDTTLLKCHKPAGTGEFQLSFSENAPPSGLDGLEAVDEMEVEELPDGSVGNDSGSNERTTVGINLSEPEDKSGSKDESEPDHKYKPKLIEENTDKLNSRLPLSSRHSMFVTSSGAHPEPVVVSKFAQQKAKEWLKTKKENQTKLNELTSLIEGTVNAVLEAGPIDEEVKQPSVAKARKQINEYTLAMMTNKIKNSKQPHLEPNTIYLYSAGKESEYAVSDPQGNLRRGKLERVNLTNLEDKLTDKGFKQEILKITRKVGHTRGKVAAQVARDHELAKRLQAEELEKLEKHEGLKFKS